MRNYPELTDIEWQAVSIALSDAGRHGCTSEEPTGRFGGFLRRVFGRERAQALADPRLEAIRGFVCEARLSRRLPEQRVQGLLASGFNRDQIMALAMLAA